MIETKILDAAVGVQRQDVIDKSETTVLPSLANGVMAGHFKRGRMDKPFKVTAKNYKALLGHDPSNPSYLAVEDAFKRGVSEVSILRTGGTGMACIASYAIASEYLDSEFGEWITVSRNGGEFKSFDLNDGDGDYKSFERSAYLGQDGKSLAFLDYEYQIDPEAIGGGQMLDGRYEREELYYYTFCGIASSGMLNTPTGNYDLKSTGVQYPSIGNEGLGMLVTSNKNITRAEHNWLVFKPTPDTDPDFDLFYKMGASGDTIEVHSCAVVEPYVDPNVCIPTGAGILYRNGQNEPTGDVYGRYRVNGGAWVDYIAPASYYLADEFLRHTGVMQSQGGGGESAFQFGINSRFGNLTGASVQQPYADGQDGVISVKRTTVDFELTDGGTNDLVQLLFGGSISVSSCAIGQWYGI